MSELNAYLVGIGYYPLGRCACKGKPFRWKNREGHEVKHYKDNNWQHIVGGIVRYGKIETAIDEIKEYYQQLVGEAHHEAGA